MYLNKLLKLNFDVKTLKLMKILNYSSIFFCFLGICILYIFNKFYISINLYKSSLIIFRTGLFINIFSIICGYVVTGIKEGKLN